MEPEGSLLCSKQPATGPYPGRDESNPKPHTAPPLFLLGISDTRTRGFESQSWLQIQRAVVLFIKSNLMMEAQTVSERLDWIATPLSHGSSYEKT
jgi:hypothetical protein